MGQRSVTTLTNISAIRITKKKRSIRLLHLTTSPASRTWISISRLATSMLCTQLSQTTWVYYHQINKTMIPVSLQDLKPLLKRKLSKNLMSLKWILKKCTILILNQFLPIEPRRTKMTKTTTILTSWTLANRSNKLKVGKWFIAICLKEIRRFEN